MTIFLCEVYFARVDWGILRKNYNFFLDKCTCSKAGVPVFYQVHLSSKKLSYAKLARVDDLLQS